MKVKHFPFLWKCCFSSLAFENDYIRANQLSQSNIRTIFPFQALIFDLNRRSSLVISLWDKHLCIRSCTDRVHDQIVVSTFDKRFLIVIVTIVVARKTIKSRSIEANSGITFTVPLTLTLSVAYVSPGTTLASADIV